MDLRRFFAHKTWWGKLIGAFLGFLVAGPVGAFFGILVGNFFDRGLYQHFSDPFWPYQNEKRQTVKNIFIEAVFSSLGHISKSDGRVSEQDIQLALSVMKQMNLNQEQKTAAQHFFNEGKKENFKLTPILVLLKKAAFDNQNLLKLYVDTQYKAVQRDGLSVKKVEIMNTILNRLQLAPIHQQKRFNDDFFRQSTRQQQSSYTRSERPTSPSSSTLVGAFSILQISPTSNKQEVKRAYRRLISKNHPDKLQAQGESSERIKLANEKTQVIRKAYEKICASKGW